MKAVEERLWEKVDKSGDCWIWLGYRLQSGYGQMNVNGKRRRVHRVAWELSKGRIREYTLLLHNCGNKDCVRPSHMFLGGIRDNMDLMRERGKGLAGERNGNAKLNVEKVNNIRILYFVAKQRQVDIARAFSVSSAQISSILSKRYWA